MNEKCAKRHKRPTLHQSTCIYFTCQFVDKDSNNATDGLVSSRSFSENKEFKETAQNALTIIFRLGQGLDGLGRVVHLEHIHCHGNVLVDLQKVCQKRDVFVIFGIL